MDINLKNETSTLKMIDKHSAFDSTDDNDEKAPQSGIYLSYNSSWPTVGSANMM